MKNDIILSSLRTTNLVGATATSTPIAIPIAYNEVTILGINITRTGELNGSEVAIVEIFDRAAPVNACTTAYNMVARRYYPLVTASQAWPSRMYVGGSDILAASSDIVLKESQVEYKDEDGTLYSGNIHAVLYNPDSVAQQYCVHVRYKRRAM